MRALRRCLPRVIASLIAAAAGGAQRDSQPLSPQQSLAALHVAPGYEAQLVAAEPLISSPVAIDFGPDGRLWVVEMADYPYGIDGKGKPGGRVKVLEDTDGDGVFDKATTFLDSVNMPNGICAWRDGALVTAAPDILFAREISPGAADTPKVLFTGFRPGNPQLRVNGLRWGLDGWLYCANGWSGGEPASVKTGRKINLNGKDLRLNPDTGDIETQSGMSEFGRDRDDWGNWFGCDNSHPLFQFVLEDRYLHRNPYAAFPDLRSQIVTPPNPQVFPVSRPQKRYYNDRLGFVTSACSSMIYRDELLFPGESNRHLFVCEPAYNLVLHEVMEPSGATFSAHRPPAESNREFLASEDNWFRPVMARTGPDGALWVVDMYRYMIEHPDWLPKQGKQDLKDFYRDGENLGRIYRIYPKGKRPGALPKLAQGDTAGALATLASDNGTLRDIAQKRLVWDANVSAAPQVAALVKTSPRPQVRLQSLWTLQCLGTLEDASIIAALSDPDANVRRGAVQLAESRGEAVRHSTLKLAEDPSPVVRVQLACTLGEWKGPAAGAALAKLAARAGDDPFVTAAILSSAPAHLPELGEPMAAPNIDVAGRLYSGLLATAVGESDRATVARLMSRVTSAVEGGKYATSQYEALGKFLDALRKRQKTPADLLFGADLAAAEKMAAGAAAVAAAPDACDDLRAAAIEVLGREARTATDDEKVLAECLTVKTPAPVRSAAIRVLGRLEGRNDVSKVLLAPWDTYGPSARTEVVDVMLGRPQLALDLLEAIDAGRIARTQIDAPRRERLMRSRDARVKDAAARVLGSAPASDREAVVKSYQDALALKGDPARGRKAFEQNCATCHRKGPIGADIGPNLASVVGWTPDALLTAILDPNKQVEPRYQSFTVTLTSGDILFGIITAENGGTLSVKQLDGKERTLPRNEVRTLTGTNRSLMPDGFESALSPQTLADVIAFLEDSDEKGTK